MKEKRDIARLNEIIQFSEHEEKVAVAEQCGACLLDEKVLRFGKRNNEIRIHRHDRNHERKRREDAEEPTLKESFKRNSSRGDLFVDHGQTNNKTRHHEEHVHANETTAERSYTQMAQHHQCDCDCAQKLNFFANSSRRCHYTSVVEQLVTQRVAELLEHARQLLALQHIREWKVWTTTLCAHDQNLVR